LAIDGPIFKKKVKILKDKKEWHRDSGVYIIEDAVLEEKWGYKPISSKNSLIFSA